jgi:hypothetical protein
VKVKEVPQDITYSESVKRVCYALNDEGKYVIVPSLGRDADEVINGLAVNELAANLEETRKAVLAGLKSPLLPGFRLSGIDETLWKTRGWDVDDYLPHCGISSTASAYGLARALLSKKSSLIVHCNHHATGRLALVMAITK